MQHDLTHVANINPRFKNGDAVWIAQWGVRDVYFKIADFHELISTHRIHGSISGTVLTLCSLARTRANHR
jgi:hypothetical protein